MNFSLLLTRIDPVQHLRDVLYPNYPDPMERALISSMIQVLWDRGEANGYAWHMTRDPPPGTPRHTVLLHQAFGDHQVANVATEVEARVIGARLRTPALDPGRSLDRQPYYGIPRIRAIPDGNALVVYDIGPLRRPAAAPRARPPGTPAAERCRREWAWTRTPLTGPSRRRRRSSPSSSASTARSSTPAAASPATRRLDRALSARLRHASAL